MIATTRGVMSVRTYIAQQTANMSEDKKRAYAFRLTRNIMIHEIVGKPPTGTLQRHAWDYRKQNARDFINNYYTAHECFPRGVHNIGYSYFPAVFNNVDFTKMREAVKRDVTINEIDDYPQWVKREV